MSRLMRSLCAALALFGGYLVFSLAAPASACGCGAYIPNQGGASVVDDYVFEQAASDSTYHAVIYRTRNRGDLTGQLLLAALAATALVTVVVLGRRASRR